MKRLPEPPIPIRGVLFYVLSSKKCLCAPATDWFEGVVLGRAEVNANRSTLLAFICLPNIKTGAQRFASQTFAGAVAIGFEHRLLLIDQLKFSLKAM